MALHLVAKPKSNADRDLRWAKTESQRKSDKAGLAQLFPDLLDHLVDDLQQQVRR